MKRRRRGAVLIMVMFLIVVLGAICALLVSELVPSAARVRRRFCLDRARDAADSGMAVAEARLAADASYKGEENKDAGFTVTVAGPEGNRRITSVGSVPWRNGRVAYTLGPLPMR